MRKVIVDTYAILSAATDTLTPVAKNCMLEIKVGKMRGFIHYLIFYEIMYHWRRGRLPAFAREEDVIAYLTQSFREIRLDDIVAAEAAKVKVLGDKMLMENVLLHDRKLSGCDATTIAVGKMLQMPIVSGDKDLMYVGEQFGVKVVW